MLKSVYYPNKTNAFAWVNVLFLIIFVALGKVDAHTILLAYFFETLIIGFFNVVKMYWSYKHNNRAPSILLHILFFIIHYSFFVAVQSVFLFLILSMDKTLLIKEPFNLIDNFTIAYNLKGMPLVLTILFSTQLMKFVFDFLMPKKYETFKVEDIMYMPYFRIFIQQLTVILGGFFIVFSSAPKFAAIVLIILRFIVDFVFVAIKEDSKVLDYFVNKFYNGKIPKDKLKKQLLLFTE